MSRDPKRASLVFRAGSPTASPEGPPSDHRNVRRARPRPAVSMASAIRPTSPKGDRSRWPDQRGACQALATLTTRAFLRAPRRAPAVPHETAEPYPHLPDPKAHGTRARLARAEPAARSAPGLPPKGSAGLGSDRRRLKARSRCRNRDRDESFDLDPLGLNRRPPSQTWIRRPLPEERGSQSQPSVPTIGTPPPPPEGDSNRGSSGGVRSERQDSTALEAFGPSTPKDRDASSSEEPASPALGSRKPSSSRTCRHRDPEGPRRFQLRRAVEPSARRIRRALRAQPRPKGRSHTEARIGDPRLSRFQRRDLDPRRPRRDAASFRALLPRSQLELLFS
jgi:hypothetical protein